MQGVPLKAQAQSVLRSNFPLYNNFIAGGFDCMTVTGAISNSDMEFLNTIGNIVILSPEKVFGIPALPEEDRSAASYPHSIFENALSFG